MEDNEEKEGQKDDQKQTDGEEDEEKQEEGEEEEAEASADREEHAEEERCGPNEELLNHLIQSDSQRSAPSSGLQESELCGAPSHGEAETGSEDSHAADKHNEDVSLTSPSSDKEPEAASTRTAAPADTELQTVDARLPLRDHTQVETSMTSLPAPGEDNIHDITADLQTDLQASGCRSEEKETLMDEAAQSPLRAGPESDEPGPTQNSTSEANEDEGGKEEGGENAHAMNGKAEAAGDKKKDGSQSSKYKSVSYRKIRRGNTRLRIDEFESMMNS
ncbi:uncharacterized protein ermn [Acanthopagrus schlegelii]